MAFLTPDVEKREEVQTAELKQDGGLSNVQKSSLEELEKHLAEKGIPERVFIKERIFEDLKGLFGKNVEVLVTY